MAVLPLTASPTEKVSIVQNSRPRLIESFNPGTGESLGMIPSATPEEVRAAMATARIAQKSWEALGLRRRLALIENWQVTMLRQRGRLLDMISREQGKPQPEVMAELIASLELISYQRRNAPHILRDRRPFVPLLPERRHRIEQRAYGVVVIIAPWNFPLILSVAPILSALIAGNTVLYKPSEYSSQTGQLIADLIHEAGIPREVFQIVQGYGDVGSALIDAQPNKICFTGSVATGRKVAAAAGERLIPLTLELGGKDAAIVLEDADLDRAALGITWAGLVNAGQACLSVERVYVMRSVADRLIEKMAAVIDRHVTLGPGIDAKTTMGAIITPMQLQIIDDQVREAVRRGARIITGGGVIQTERGRFFAPTIITDLPPDVRLLTDETFGPVLPIIPVDSEAEAIQLANGTNFGLTASIWTRNTARGLAIAREMRVGNAGVNDHIISATAPQLPWGGVGESGYGRTRGVEGLLEMVRPQALSTDRFPVPRSLFWYPYTPLKNDLFERIAQFRYSTTWRDRLRAFQR